MINLKKLRSGNYKISHNSEYDISLKSEEEIIDFWKKNINGYTKYRKSYGSRIIKATYSQSQTYYTSVLEFIYKNNDNKG